MEFVEREREEKMGVSWGVLRVKDVGVETPAKILTNTELRAGFAVKVRAFPDLCDIRVVGRLIDGERLEAVTKDEDAFKRLVQTMERDGREARVRVPYFNFIRGARVENYDHLRTLLDAQWMSGMDILVVQHHPDVGVDELRSFLTYARRWRERRGLDLPIMPVVCALPDLDAFKEVLGVAVEFAEGAVGVDFRSRFSYMTLKAIEDLKEEQPDLWVHAFQVPPRVLLRGQRAAQGMVLPFFGFDTWSQHVVPPPPVPVVKEKVNVFEPHTWGVYRQKMLYEEYRRSYDCPCPVCQQSLDRFYEGTDLDVLRKSKVHNHLRQRDQLELLREHARSDTVPQLIAHRRYADQFLRQFPTKQLQKK